MGVTLERVQNKFACIIGELCSEPVILSKFAIWLDLRLAEYKAKGAISLDCSGENPDPGWLKGHEKPVCVQEEKQPLFESQYPYDHPSSRSPGNVRLSSSVSRTDDGTFSIDNSLAEDSLEPDIVVVKEESDIETPDLFPVSLHRVEASLSRKRHGPPESSSTSSFQAFSQLPAKVGRFSDNLPSTSEDESANQSLISIINKTKEDDTGTNLHLPATKVNPDLPSDQGHVPGQSMGDNSVSFSPQHLSTSSTPQHLNISPSRSADDSSSLQLISLQPLDSELPFPQNSGFCPGVDPALPTCPVCKRTFATVGSLQRHIQLHIPNSKRFACSVCGSKFRRLEHVRAHLRSVHPAVAASGELYKETGGRRAVLSFPRRPRNKSGLPRTLANGATNSASLSLRLVQGSVEMSSSLAMDDRTSSRQHLALPSLPLSQGIISCVGSQAEANHIKLEPTNT